MASTVRGTRGKLVGLDEVAKALAEAQSRWPALRLMPATYARFLASKVPEGEVPEEVLPRLRLVDLYLACACVEGLDGAVRALEAMVVPEVNGALRHAGISDAIAQETQQILLTELCVAKGDTPPAIVGYSGRGGLKRWVRTIALRTSLRLLRSRDKERAVEDEELARVPALGADPEVALLKRTYGAAFRKAFDTALAALTVRERNLLRQHLVDGLGIDRLAGLYHVHRATAARWAAQARQALLDGTLAALRADLRVNSQELRSVVRLVQSQLDLSLVRVLGKKVR